MATQIDLAVSQFYGYYHAKLGYGLIDLVKAMGLKKSEWNIIKKKEKNIPSDDKKEIDKYFNQ